MSSGTLPEATYHRASQVGEGSFGSVLTVYNDDGEEYALKIFERASLDDDSDEDSDEDNSAEESPSNSLLDLGAMREISCLRLLRAENGHTNIVPLVDIQSEWVDDEDAAGAGTSGSLGMALPLYKSGSLNDAIENGFFQNLARRHKVHIAHGLLSAVAFLHDNGILHRDIKSDNVLLQPVMEDDDNDNDNHYYPGQQWKAVLIDFSLAKPIDGTLFSNNNNSSSSSSSGDEENDTPTKTPKAGGKATTSILRLHSHNYESVQHTGEVGTVTYTAPEVWRANEEDDDKDDDESSTSAGMYGKPIDLWSVGIVLLELVMDELLDATKHAQGLRQVQDLLETRFSDTSKPFPSLLHGLLQVDPANRLTARQALQHDLFQKFHMVVSNNDSPTHRVCMAQALPLDTSHEEDDDDDDEGDTASTPRTPRYKSKRNKLQLIHQKRLETIQRILQQEGATNPLTASAAFEYAQMMSQLDDEMDDKLSSASNTLLDCIVLAYRCWEVDVLDLKELDARQDGAFASWSLQEYVDNESTIFMLMDYCLYPRQLHA